MADYLDEAKISPVFYERGRFSYAEGNKRYVQAPFVLVTMQTSASNPFETFCMPRAFGGGYDSIDQELPDVANGLEREFGYLDLGSSLIIGENQCGDFQGHPDDWRGFFQIGQI